MEKGEGRVHRPRVAFDAVGKGRGRSREGGKVSD